MNLAFLRCRRTTGTGRLSFLKCRVYCEILVSFSVFMHQAGNGGLSGLCRITDHLYLSNKRAANDSSLLKVNGISCVINVTEHRGSSPPGTEYIHLPVSDTPLAPLGEHFGEVADKIRSTAEGGGRVLVHCNAGVSRSAALCMAYLMKHRGVTLLEAHGWVRACRPLVRPNPGFWRQLIQYEAELRGCNTVRMASSSIGEIPDVYTEEARSMVPL